MDISQKSIKIIRMFQEVVQRLIKEDWSLTPSSQIVVKCGLERLDKLFPNGCSDGRIVSFIVYQIYRYRDMIGVKGTRWNLLWCFSDKAVERFKHQFLEVRSKTGMMYYIDQWLNEADISREDLVKMIGDTGHRLNKFIYMCSEDETKRRFFNTEMGYMLCIQSTTGWTPMSPVCQKCRNTEKCIESSSKRYPELIRLRKENYGKK